MEAIFMSSAAEKSVYPNKQQQQQQQQLIKNNIPWRNNSCGPNFFSNPNENLLPHTRFIHGRSGSSTSDHLLFGPPFTYHPLLNPLMYQNQHQQAQPPLLPLPVPSKQPVHSSVVPYRTRSLSSSPSNVKSNRNKDQSLTPPKRSKSKSLKPTTTEATKNQAVNKPYSVMMPSAAAKPLGPPKVVVAEDLDRLSSSIFTLSPPPSSLPLPSFSLRPKLSCNAQAASVDDVGASTDHDNLRRLLRLP